MSEIKYHKIKILILFLLLFILLYLLLFVISKTYASYESDGGINLDVQAALYIFDEGKMNFNIDLDKLIPSEEPYIYTFTISNYDGSKRSDVDMEYNISMLTTTNLPLTYELYYNQNHDEIGADNIISDMEYKTDIDGTWYRAVDCPNTYTFNYNVNKIDTYRLVVYFPISYSNMLGYDGLTDNIEITINSKQRLVE